MNEKIAKALCDAGVVKFGTFKLVSGRISPVYVDVRVLPSYPEPMQIVADELSKKAKNMRKFIKEKKCYCHHNCNFLDNIFLNPSQYPKLLFGIGTK